MSHLQHTNMRRRGVILLCGALLSAGAVAGCTRLLDVDAPQLIEESTLQIAANAPVIVAGAVGEFECAFGSYIVTMGLIGDEFADAQGNAATWDLDRRTNNPANGLYTTATCTGLGGTYTPLSTARYANDNAVKLLEGWTDAEVPNRQKLIGQAYAYAGYSLTLLGEGMCSAAINLGPEIQPPALFTEAVARFTKAIAAEHMLSPRRIKE